MTRRKAGHTKSYARWIEIQVGDIQMSCIEQADMIRRLMERMSLARNWRLD
jgi:hypothetical protein